MEVLVPTGKGFCQETQQIYYYTLKVNFSLVICALNAHKSPEKEGNNNLSRVIYSNYHGEIKLSLYNGEIRIMSGVQEIF